jgi:hypothetical protein
MDPKNLHLVLRHDHVLGRGGKIIHASVTQIDLHDFCRLSLTYGLGGFHCVTEMEAQHRICREILDYWRAGPGQSYNPDRVEALQVLHLYRDFGALVEDIEKRSGKPPLLIGTSAKGHEKNLAINEALAIIKNSGRTVLIQFGTSWGLSPDQLRRCDGVLPPVEGHDGYNHLSVRCAAAILVDRIFREMRIKEQE